MKTKDLILLGALGIGAYFALKMLSGSANGNGGGGYSPTPTIQPTIAPVVVETPGGTEVVPIYVPDTKPKPKIIYYNNQGGSLTIPAPLGTEKGISQAPSAWTNTTYGMPGQPSVNFLSNTIKAGAQSKNKITGGDPIAAIGAGAPPRVVAKIKAGKIF